MKILTVGNFGYGWDGSVCDEEHIAKALGDLGHDVHRIQRENLPTVNKNIWTKTEDLVLIAQWDGYPAGFIEDMKSLGKVIVYWAFDYQADGQEWHEKLIQGSDLYLSKRLKDSKYQNWQWLSQDFAPEFLDKYTDPIKQDIDVLFTGSYLPWAKERNSVLRAIDSRFNLEIHSITPNDWKTLGFKNVQGPVMDYDLPKLVARAKINISIDHTIEAGYWSDRPGQIMACGGFVLHRYQPLAEARFHNGVDYFYGIQDCLDAIGYYLAHGSAREAIQARGYQLAQRTLMAEHRAKDLLTIVGSIL